MWYLCALSLYVGNIFNQTSWKSKARRREAWEPKPCYNFHSWRSHSDYWHESGYICIHIHGRVHCNNLFMCLYYLCCFILRFLSGVLLHFWSFRWLLWLMLVGDLVLYFTWILSLCLDAHSRWGLSMDNFSGHTELLCGSLGLKPKKFLNLLVIVIRCHYLGMCSAIAFIWPRRDMLYIWWPLFSRNHMKYLLVLFLVFHV